MCVFSAFIHGPCHFVFKISIFQSFFRLGSLSKESKQEKDAKDDNEAKTETSPVSGKQNHYEAVIECSKARRRDAGGF